MKKIVTLLTILVVSLFSVRTVVFADEPQEQAVESSLLYITFTDPELGQLAPNQKISLSGTAAFYTVNAPEIEGYSFSGATYYKDQDTLIGQEVTLPLTIHGQAPLEGYQTHIQWVKLSYVRMGLKPVYRLYHPGLQVHLYTTDSNEYSILQNRGWRDEGRAWTTEVDKGEEVYRLYHSDLKVHLYTKDKNEYQVLAERGWSQEGVAYRSHGDDPVYRLYNANIKKHLYTKDANEYKVLAERGWLQEGIAWYSQP